MRAPRQRWLWLPLSLDPQKEEFWDQLSEHAAEISMVGIRSNTIVEEIDDLIAKLPED